MTVRRCDGQPANLLPDLQSCRRLRDRRIRLAPGLERPCHLGVCFAEYEANMEKFIEDVRLAVGVPDLPFVIATTGQSDPRSLQPARAGAAGDGELHAYPEFNGNVAVVDAKPFLDSGTSLARRRRIPLEPQCQDATT